MLAHYWKANEVYDVKWREQKNIQNKAIKMKLSLYINKYMKKETLQIFWYSLLNIPVCACVCVYN